MIENHDLETEINVHNSLNIPLETNPTRQHAWRVVWIFFILLFFITFGWCVFRLLTNTDRTAVLRPQNTAYTLQVRYSAKTYPILTENLGTQQAFFGQPWTINDFLHLSKKRISLHMNEENEIIAFTVDKKEIPPELRNIAKARNITIRSSGYRTIFSVDPDIYEAPGSIFTLAAIDPNYSGQFIRYENEPIFTGIRIKQEGIFILENTILPEPIFTPFIPADAHVLGRIPSKTTFFSKNLFSDTIIYKQGDEIKQIVSYKDANFPLDTLRSYANELISLQSLTTTGLILQDRTRVSEIRTERGPLHSDIKTDGIEQNIRLWSDQGDFIHFIQNNGILRIANFEITTSLENPLFDHTNCLPRSVYFIQPKALTELITEHDLDHISDTVRFFDLFNEIAFSETKTAYCW